MKKIFILVLLISSTLAQSNENLIVKEINLSVKAAMDKFEKRLISKKFNVFSRINHGMNAKNVNFPLKANEVIIFGKPQIGTKLMQENPLMGLELPLKVVIFEIDENNSKLSYISPKYFSSHYDIKNSKVIAKITKVLNKLTNLSK
jgi:uncharacterized protein (DUF302 family)